jgi:hypothetical protein
LTVSPGITDEIAPFFVAWDLNIGMVDPQEDLAIRRLPFRDAVTAALDGTISDGPSVATVLAVRTRADQGTLPEDLVRRLA